VGAACAQGTVAIRVVFVILKKKKKNK
jgi:hypothetical protein